MVGWDIGVADPDKLSGWSEDYRWRVLQNIDRSAGPNRPGLPGYANRSRRSFDRIAASWDQASHTEWMVRSFLALKLIMGATVQLAAANYAGDRNLRIAVPYLAYYGLFNAVRAAIIMSPATTWGKKTFGIGHGDAMKAYEAELRCLMDEPALEDEIATIDEARAGRELQSYRFPGAGAPGRNGMYVYTDEAERVATLAAELALFNSWCLAAAVERRHADQPSWDGFEADGELLDLTWQHDVGAQSGLFLDDEDSHYAARMGRKVRKPLPLIYLIGEGGIDNFFMAYAREEDGDEEQFDADEYWHVLLDLP